MSDLNLKASNMCHDAEDFERCEYVVIVKWLAKEEAYWVKGLKANQNSAYKLRSQYTIDKVLEFFELNTNE